MKGKIARRVNQGKKEGNEWKEHFVPTNQDEVVAIFFSFSKLFFLFFVIVS